MLPLVLYARNEHQGVLIFCPHCKMGVRHDSGDISNAIHDGLEVVCVACEKPFKIVVMSLTRQPEQRNDAETGIQDAELCDCGEPFPKNGECRFCGARQRHLS